MSCKNMSWSRGELASLLTPFYLSGISGTVSNMSLLTIHIKLRDKLMDPAGIFSHGQLGIKDCFKVSCCATS